MAGIGRIISSAKNFPWISLILLLLSYTIVGKFLSRANAHWVIWALTVGWILLLAVFFMSPLESTRSLLYRWLRTDTVAFIVLTIMAALISVVLAWWDFSL